MESNFIVKIGRKVLKKGEIRNRKVNTVIHLQLTTKKTKLILSKTGFA